MEWINANGNDKDYVGGGGMGGSPGAGRGTTQRPPPQNRRLGLSRAIPGRIPGDTRSCLAKEIVLRM